MKNNFITSYFIGAYQELKRVTWPSKKTVVDHTVMVIVSASIAIAVTSAIDYGLTTFVQYIVENKI